MFIFTFGQPVDLSWPYAHIYEVVQYRGHGIIRLYKQVVMGWSSALNCAFIMFILFDSEEPSTLSGMAIMVHVGRHIWGRRFTKVPVTLTGIRESFPHAAT
ncbi:hypothetical protein GXY_00489 [Novacetimonas hansenii ATCC 23769]|uniref:Uncharacterized protein n=1 Tax=Novacetimonas hansenii ATCC 23769 TaxID=714995 RepID=D5QAG3_NOVHA|nr:hypothetical protein GXY_00489 [Novacetimonas hansenii ATCC 23769]